MSKVTGVIVLEGPDGAGKTTLAERLCERFNGVYVHRTWWRGGDMWRHHTAAIQLANEISHNQLVVIDRLWASEAIYGQVYRGESDYKHNSRSMDRVLLRLAALNVLCVPPVQYVKEVHARKHAQGLEMYDTVEDVAIKYHQWAFGAGTLDGPGSLNIVEQQAAAGGFLKLRNDAHHYDVTIHGADMDKYCDELVAYLDARQKMQFPYALDYKTPNLLGHRLDADFLFVGEEVGDLHAWSEWPFYARSHSPDFLNRALHEIGFQEHRGLWTNALNKDNELSRIYQDAFVKPKVIALGKKAEKRCKQLGVPVHASIPHPQWARRFNHHGNAGPAYHLLLDQALS